VQFLDSKPVAVSRDYELALHITMNRHAEGLTSRTPGPVDPSESYVFARVGYVLD
jgi:hypothetical protein